MPFERVHNTGIQPKMDLGQNFLTNQALAQKIVDLLNLKQGESIIEVGPGLGVLTEKIVHKMDDSNKLIAVEIDPRLVTKLQVEFEHDLRVIIQEHNILDWLWKYHPEENFRILGALPYYITSPIIKEIIRMQKLPEVVVLIVQKEVAEKIVASPPNSTLLGALVGAFFDTEIAFDIGPEEFSPQPKITSSAIVLNKKLNLPLKHPEKRTFEGFLNKAYSNPRKMLNKVFNEEEFALFGDSILQQQRPQEVSAETWLKAFLNLANNNQQQ